jgi:glutathione S-transferase
MRFRHLFGWQILSVRFHLPFDFKDTMKLFYHPAACSLAVHIALIETDLPFELVSITRDKRTSDNRDYHSINPHGFVPALEFEDGAVLSEALANLVYIAETTGKLLPKDGPTRWIAIATLSFMTTEIHGNFKPLWKRHSEIQQEIGRQSLVTHFASLAIQLDNRPVIAGDEFTIADVYLFVMLRWARTFAIEISNSLDAYFDRIRKTPSVTHALSEEGLE